MRRPSSFGTPAFIDPIVDTTAFAIHITELAFGALTKYILVLGQDVDTGESSVGVERYPIPLRLLPVFGFDEDNAMGSAGAIEGCCVGAFQHTYVLNIFGVEVGDGIAVIA